MGNTNTIKTGIRKLHYFHIMHAKFELDLSIKFNGWTTGTDISVIKLWSEIGKILENLPTPDKMYSDSYLRSASDNKDIQIFGPAAVHQGIISVIGNNRASHNDTTILKLAKRGCALVMCEDAKLHGRCIGSKTLRDKIQYMYQRNAFIADQIHRSLYGGETGVLFLGRLHNLGNDMVNRLNQYGIDVTQHNSSEFTAETDDYIRLTYPDRW